VVRMTMRRIYELAKKFGKDGERGEGGKRRRCQ